jgi:hypothetical protein
VTPKKIHQLNFRLNEWLKNAKIPLEVRSKNNFLEILPRRPLEIQISNTNIAEPKLAIFIGNLNQNFTRKSFTSHEASIALNIPLRSVTRLLRSAIEQGYVMRLGAGPKSLFTLNTKLI